MIIYVDGPRQGGKTVLVNAIGGLFEPDYLTIKTNSGFDKQDGFGFMHDLLSGVDSNKPTIIDTGWVSESVLGKIKGEDRQLAYKPFWGEWLYSRLVNGRGGRFIVLPRKIGLLEKNREDELIEEDAIWESYLFGLYAQTWGYKILWNEYNRKSKKENARIAFIDSMISKHKLSSVQYVGPKNPTITFIGETRQDFPFVNRPFFNIRAAQYFEPFGIQAIQNFGYMQIDAAKRLPLCSPLLRLPIAVGTRAQKAMPNIPGIFDVNQPATEIRKIDFVNAITKAVKGVLK